MMQCACEVTGQTSAQQREVVLVLLIGKHVIWKPPHNGLLGQLRKYWLERKYIPSRLP